MPFLDCDPIAVVSQRVSLETVLEGASNSGFQSLTFQSQIGKRTALLTRF